MPDLISAEHTYAVGSLVLAVSKIESRITSLIAGFTEIDILSALITVHHQQLTNRIDSLLALMHVYFRGEAEFDPIVDPVKRAKELTEFRNTVVHCHWITQPDGSVMAVRFQARGTFSRSRRPMSAQEIQKRADEAFEIAEKLARISKAFPPKPIEVPPEE